MKKLRKVAFIGLLCAALLAACKQSDTPTAAPTLDATALYQTAEYQVTQDAVQTQNALTSPTITPVGSWTPEPTIDRTRPSIQTPTAEKTCNQAAAGHPFDVTIPDDTILAPGETFSKTWRLENDGSCAWSRAYTVVFFSGNSLGAYQTQALTGEVQPGQEIDVTVEMQAPTKPGVYQSNWMLSDPEGNLFGIGPNGDAPFWVRIEVSEAVTSTPTLTPTVTSTPAPYQQGSVSLVDGDRLDLDAGVLNPADETRADFSFTFGGDPNYVLTPLNAVLWAAVSEAAPAYADCVNANLNGNAIGFASVPAGTAVCYQTSGDLIGRFLIKASAGESLSLDYLTWTIP